jgi:ATP-dependent Lon protease
MAWTPMGGELLFAEVSLMHGTGRVQITGRLGEVMKESVHAALSFVRANANKLGIYSEAFRRKDIHIHFPEGNTPKEGPSAGVTLTTAIVSAFTGVPVRKEIAMTGEVTLRGKVLQIGGLKEKLLAAKRGGVEEALIPKENESDLSEVPREIKKGLKVTPLRNVYEYLEHALEQMPDEVEDPDDTSTGDLREGMIQPNQNVEAPQPSVYTGSAATRT